MAVTFLEPGGDATFNNTTTASGGFWQTANGNTATDFVHGNHVRSLKFSPNLVQRSITPDGTCADAGTRISFYLYLSAYPSANSNLAIVQDSLNNNVVVLLVGSTGILTFQGSTGSGSNMGTGSTLSLGVWYRISIAYTITSSSVNEFRIYLNGVLDMTFSNQTVATTGSTRVSLGNPSGNVTFDLRTSDHYLDNSAALTDPGNIWVTAKRPNANGTTNDFSTQIGSGGSGYGSGHSPQINERPSNTANGWSMVGAGSAVTEEYNIENKTVGDIDIAGATIVDWVGWANMKSLVGETVQMVLNGANSAQAITSTITLYKKVKGSSTYPAGTGTDIGIITDTSLTTVSLYECGIVVAYIPGAIGPFPTHLP